MRPSTYRSSAPRIALAATVLGLTLAGCLSLRSGRVPAAHDLLARSIAYHDPEGVWGTRPLRLVLLESRRDGERSTHLVLDGGAGRFDLERREGDTVLEGRIAPGECRWNLAAGDFAAAAARDLSCDSLRWTRDFYSYVWGLPMKLRDPGARLGAVSRAKVAGRRVLRLRVTYDPEVGSDVWDFDFDPATHALVGYRFFHDEAAGDGEWIALEGEAEGAGMRLPRTRSWYMNADDEWVGRDRLDSVSSAPPARP